SAPRSHRLWKKSDLLFVSRRFAEALRPNASPKRRETIASICYLRMDWTKLRDEFPVTRRWAFFDHAAVAPITGRAQQALAEWAADMAENGDVNERRWVQRVEEVRGLAGQLLNADPLDIAFIKNTSEGIGIVAEGLPWQPGDNVITAQEEYPANIYPWL